MRNRHGFCALITMISALMVGVFPHTFGFNYKASKADTTVDSNIFSVQMRSGGGDSNYVVVLDHTIDPYGSSLSFSDVSEYNAPSHIKIYTSADDEGILLSTIISSHSWKVNLWSSNGVMFPLSEETYETYNGTTVYAIEVLKDCTYPNNQSQTVVNKSIKRYVNNKYGDPTAKNEAFSWAEEIVYERSEEEISLSGVQLRADVDGNLYYLCLSSSSYHSVSIIEYGFLNQINAYDKIKLCLDSDDPGTLLSEITTSTSGCQNKWGSDSFHFALKAEEYEIYNGVDVYQIVIESGCELVLNNKIVTVDKGYTFINEHYHDDEQYKYGSFRFYEALERSDKTLDIAGAEVRADPNAHEYYIDLRCHDYLPTTPTEYSELNKFINAYDKIIVYLSEEDEGHTLGEITTLRTATQNKYESQAFMFHLTEEEYEIYNGTTVYRIKALEGCELIFNSKICTITEPIDLLNNSYGDETAKYQAFSFRPYVAPVSEPIPLRNAQVRGDVGANKYYIDLVASIYNDTPAMYYDSFFFLNSYSKIKVFLSEDDEGTLLEDVTSLRKGAQNIWNDSCALLFELTAEEYEIYNGTTVYAIEVLEGCQLVVNGSIGIVDKAYRFINNDYGNEAAKYEAFNFSVAVKDLENVGTVQMKNLHNRMDKDSGHRWMIFLFEDNIYDTNMVINHWIDRTNFLDNVLIYFKKGGEPITLREIFNVNTGGVTLRQFGERNMLGVSISNEKDENGDYKYDGPHMYMVVLKAGTQIPTYENNEAGYRIIEDKTVLINNDYEKTGPTGQLDDKGRERLYEDWNLNWSIVGCLVTFTVVGIDDLEFDDVNLEQGQSLSLSLFEQDGFDLVATTKDGDKIYRYIIGTSYPIDVILTYTPNFGPDENPSESGGCKGDIVAASTMVSVVSLLGFALLFFKKRKGDAYEE